MNGRCLFLGGSVLTLEKIKQKSGLEYPRVKIGVYSPPYKDSFSKEENNAMVKAVNDFKPDVLFIGMTAPKQEMWAYTNYSKLKAKHICSIGAVFDFYAGNIKRAPVWVQRIGCEWAIVFFVNRAGCGKDIYGGIFCLFLMF